MATNFPTSLDSFTNPLSTDKLNSPSHAAQHVSANDAIAALEAKVGIDNSAATTSQDYKIRRYSDVGQYAADAGANDTYVITLSPAPAAYYAGMVVAFNANTANTGAATLNINSLGAKTIKREGNLDLNDNDIKAGQIVYVVYDGTNFQLVGSDSFGIAPAVRVYKSAQQNISNGSQTVLTFSDEAFDTDNMHDNVTNNSRLTVNKAGLYLIKGQANYGSSATGRRQTSLTKNGTLALGSTEAPAVSGSDTIQQVTALAKLAANDYIELTAYQTSGAGMNIGTSGDDYNGTHLEMVRISA
jgi:hypothetical protein